jgi:hypothetical protein
MVGPGQLTVSVTTFVTGVHNIHNFRNFGVFVITVVMNVMRYITTPSYYLHLSVLAHLVKALADVVL